MKFSQLLKEAFQILKKEPKLFLPKIIVAALFSIEIIVFAYILLNFPFVTTSELTPEQINQAIQLFPLLIGTLIYAIFLIILDVLVNSMYPPMIKDFKDGKKVSLRSGLNVGKKRIFIVLPVIFLTALIIEIPLVFFTNYVVKNSIEFNIWLIAPFMILLSFILVIFFYLLYPVSVLENRGVFETIKTTISLSKKNFKKVALGSIIPMLLSLVSIFISFYVFSFPGLLIVFILLRFLVAIIYTYHMVLDPAIYFDVRK